MLVPDIRCPALSSWSTLGGTLGGFHPSSEQKNRPLEDLLMDTQYHNSDFDVEAQQAARDAVMEIQLFPELGVQLRKALGYGPHVDMLQHLCYWFHPRHRKMQNRWTLWKTFDEWHEECGLTERQVKKGRKVLAEKSLVTAKRGQYSRVYYRVDWLALADALGVEHGDESIPDGISVQNGKEEGSSFQTALASSFISDGITDEFIPDGITVRLNTEDYAEEYLQESSLLQRGDEPAFAEPSPPEMNGKEEDKHSSPPVGDKRHSQDSDTPSQRTAGKEKVEEPVAPPKPSDDALLAEVKDILNPDSGRWHLATHVSAKHTAETVAKGIVSEDDTGEVVHSVPYEDVEAAVEYLRWEANNLHERLHQNGTSVGGVSEEHPDGCGCLPCELPI
jgi:hypothetical protein